MFSNIRQNHYILHIQRKAANNYYEFSKGALDMYGFSFKPKKNKTDIAEKIDAVLKSTLPPSAAGQISGDFEENIKALKEIFRNDDLIEFRRLDLTDKLSAEVCLVFCDGLVNSEIIDNHLIRPLMELERLPKGYSAEEGFLSRVFQVNSIKKVKSYYEIIQGITYGDSLILLSGSNDAFLCSTKKFESRSISEPEGEKILSGPREGFTEVMMTNLSLVRRKLRTERLKMRYYQIGNKTNTQLCIAYLDGIADPDIIKRLYKRLDSIDIDGILDTNYIDELIRDNQYSPFRSTGDTERPDVVAAKLLEGRIAVFVDGTPVVLTLPHLFVENFQSNDDYYQNYYYATFSRALRILGFFITVLVPAIYIATVAFHQEMLTEPLLFSIAIERQSVPLPAAVEALVMLLAFEILRETGLRMQNNVGQALSIVGALVVGQAAVEAQLVAAPMIIIVALTGITSLLVPKMNSSILIMRFGILLLASCFGFTGVVVGFALCLIHVLTLYSFGVWQLCPTSKLSWQSIKDTAVRVPWWQMITQPQPFSGNKIRQKEKPEV